MGFVGPLRPRRRTKEDDGRRTTDNDGRRRTIDDDGRRTDDERRKTTNTFLTCLLIFNVFSNGSLMTFLMCLMISLAFIFLFVFYHRKSSNMCFFINCFDPWQETFVDAGDGDGGRGANRDLYLFHPTPNIRFLFVLK